MNSAIIRRLCLFLLTALLTSSSAVRCPAQATAEENAGSLLLPKLCMPVSYRGVVSPVVIKTRIAILGDRYQGVSEALSAWNETGVPLVGRLNGRWEAVPCGDDTGLFYLVPLLARHAGWNADRSLDVFLPGMLVFSAIAGVAGLWLTVTGAWLRLLTMPVIAFGAYFSYKMGDVYVVQSAVVLMVVPWLVHALKAGLVTQRRLTIVFLAGIVVGLAQWIRAQSGSPVLVFFAALLWLSALGRRVKILLSIAILTGVALPLLYAQFPLHERDLFLAANQPGYRRPLDRHLLWHTAYVGLSFLTNPYVVAWRDSVAVDYVQSVNQNAIYGGEEYESILRSRVKAIAHQDHRFIFYTVAAKIGVLACMLLATINVGLAAAIWCPKPLNMELAFWSAMAFGALPGIIAIPVPQYALGMIMLALYYWVYSISSCVALRQRPA